MTMRCDDKQSCPLFIGFVEKQHQKKRNRSRQMKCSNRPNPHQPLHFLLAKPLIPLPLVVVLQLLLPTEGADAALPLPEASLWAQTSLPERRPPLPQTQSQAQAHLRGGPGQRLQVRAGAAGGGQAHLLGHAGAGGGGCLGGRGWWRSHTLRLLWNWAK